MLPHSRLPLGPLSHTPIIVDDFSRSLPNSTRLTYFLTHAHADHLVGLSSTWNKGRIICTEMTQTLILLIFPDLDVGLFRTVQVGIAQTIWLDEYDHSLGNVTLTAIDANHIAGAVMFLFQGNFGTVLHTGDFRFDNHPELSAEEILTVLPDPKTIHCIYLDNTYGLQTSGKCASRTVIADKLCTCLASLPASTQISLGLDSVGKEELLIALAKRLNTRVLVTRKRLKVIEAVCPPDCHQWFVSDHDSSSARLRVGNRKDPAPLDAHVHIVLSGWGMGSHGIDECFARIVDIVRSSDDNTNTNKTVHVPYSAHSTLSELERFVTTLNPISVIPIVHEKLDGELARFKCESSHVVTSLQHYPSQSVVPCDLPRLVKRSQQGDAAEKALMMNKAIKMLDAKRRRESRISHCRSWKILPLPQSRAWSDVEDAILCEMRTAFVSEDEDRHVALRQRLCGRSDVELRRRISTLFGEGSS